MPINNNPFSNLPFSPLTQVRKPVPMVSIGGTPLPQAVISAEARNASHFAADTFRVELALSGLPVGTGISFWESVDQDTLLDVSIGLQNDLTAATPSSLVTGQIDHIDVDLCRQMITLSGRDLSARFMDNKTAETFKEQTASQIAATLAARRGLQTNIKATTTPVGQYYELQHARLNNDRTEWDLLVDLAQHENYDVWVSGKVLNFQPRLSPDTAQPYVLAYMDDGVSRRGNFLDLQLKRSLTLANDVIVKVQSWNQKQQSGFTKTARASKSAGKSGGTPQTYVFRIPNLTPAQALARAQALAEDISRHERVISARLPGDTTLNTRMMLSVTGTGSDFDQLYYPDTVTRRVSFHEGYVLDVVAKNHSTQTVTYS